MEAKRKRIQNNKTTREDNKTECLYYNHRIHTFVNESELQIYIYIYIYIYT